MKKGKLQGIIIGLIGAFVIYWAQTHSPKAKLGQIIGNQISGSYTMSETSYYLSLALGIGLVAYGVFKLVKG